MIRTLIPFLLTAALLAAPTEAAPTFPVDCAAYPDDCAGSALASPYGTKGLGDHPLLFDPAVDPPEVRMYRVTMNPALYPAARCNDGSPAVFYFAPAPAGSANADRWIFQLEGGGGCLDAADTAGLHQDCMDRWTGKGPDLLDVPRKMSTDLDRDGVTDVNFLPLEGRIPGLFGEDTVVTDPTQNGGFDAWNRVYLNYCSSDLWQGQSGPIALAGGEWTDAGGGVHTYEPLDAAIFNGHLIFDAVLDAILAGVVSDDGEHWLQLLFPSALEQVVLAGESAGGGGVAANLDYLAGKSGWGADGTGVDRGITLGVAGANTHVPFAYDDATVPWYTGPVTVQEWDYSFSPPLLVDVDLDANGTIDTDAQEAGVPLRRPVYEFVIDAFVDQSCLAANTDPAAADPNRRHWLCYRSSSLYPAGHITTPILVKQDLADPLVGAGIPSFAEGVRTMMGSLPANFWYFGPQCGRHATLSASRYFKRDRVSDGMGRQVTYHRAVQELIAGTYVSIYFDPGVTFRACPP